MDSDLINTGSGDDTVTNSGSTSGSSISTVSGTNVETVPATGMMTANSGTTLAGIDTLQGISFHTLAVDAVNAQLFNNVGTIGSN